MAARPAKRGSGRSRLSDVALMADVSLSTASKILNNVPTVSARPATRARVIEAATKLGYHPNVTARALAGRPARALALTVEELASPFYSRMIRGVFAESLELGYTMLVVEGKQVSSEAFCHLVAVGHVDGILVGSARRGRPLPESLTQHNIAHVFINRAVAGSGRNVTMDLQAASALAVSRFVGLGHRLIAHIAGPRKLATAAARAAAFTAAATMHGIDGTLVRHELFEESGGALGVRHLFQQCGDITAIFTSSLPQAVGALHSLAALGLRVPEDVSLIAYDELPIAAYLNPPLDTVAMPRDELGRTAVKALLDQIDGSPPRDIVVPTSPRLVIRRSSCSPRT